MNKPMRLGISGSCFIYTMPEDLLMAAYWDTLEGPPARLDERRNRMMTDFMREMMASVNSCGADAMECYYSRAWDDEMILDVVLDRPKVEFWSVHGPYGKHFDPSSPDEDIRRCSLDAFGASVRFAERVSAKVVVAHPGANVEYGVSVTDRLKSAVSTLRAIVEHAGELGISIAVEPLPRSEPGSKFEDVLWVVEEIGLPNVGVNFDVNHVFPPEDVPGLIRKAGDLILSVHISDQDGQERHWLPFEGTLDWKQVLGALGDAGYSGPLIYETHIHDAGNCDEVGRLVVENYGRLMRESGMIPTGHAIYPSTTAHGGGTRA